MIALIFIQMKENYTKAQEKRKKALHVAQDKAVREWRYSKIK